MKAKSKNNKPNPKRSANLGGKRCGAGRPGSFPGPKVAVTLRVSEAARNALTERANNAGVSQAHVANFAFLGLDASARQENALNAIEEAARRSADGGGPITLEGLQAVIKSAK